MSKILKSAGVALVLAMVYAPIATAAPMTGSQSLIGSAAENSVVQKVHRCHRRWRDGCAGWHKHVGRNCGRIGRHERRYNRGNRYWHRGARCDTYCVEVGPLRDCDRDWDKPQFASHHRGIALVRENGRVR